MPNLTELMMQTGGLSRMMGLGGGSVGLGNLALVVVMLAIIILRPQQIVRLGAFRRAFFLVGAAIVTVPASALLFSLMIGPGNTGFGYGGETLMLVSVVVTHLPGMLTGCAVLYLGAAMIPQFIPPADESGATSRPQQAPRPPFSASDPSPFDNASGSDS